MVLKREEIISTMVEWEKHWNEHDIYGVMDLFHEEVVFEHWHGGRVQGKLNLFQSWASWFNKHGGFRFTTEDLFADEKGQKVLYRWRLEWPSLEKGFEGEPEKRRGVDVIQFQDGKIIQKLTYSKTTVEINGAKIRFSPVECKK